MKNEARGYALLAQQTLEEIKELKMNIAMLICKGPALNDIAEAIDNNLTNKCEAVVKSAKEKGIL